MQRSFSIVHVSKILIEYLKNSKGTITVFFIILNTPVIIKLQDDTLDVEDEDDKDELEQFKFKADLSVSGSEELSASPKKANQVFARV